MTSAKYDVLGIGNAILMFWCRPTSAFWPSHGMTKGRMALIDEARAPSIYQAMGPASRCRAVRPQTPWSAARIWARVPPLSARYERPDRQFLISRHSRREGCVRYQTGCGRPRHGLLLHSGDAGRRAHHEYVSWRCAESDA